LRNREAARYARWSAMAAGLIVVAVAGAYIYRAVQRARARQEMPAAVPATVERRSAAFTYKSVDQGRTLFTLRASQVTQYKDHNRAQLQDVWITIYGRDGKQNDDIHTRECSYDPQGGGARCEGSVQIDIAGTSAKNSAAGSASPALELVTSDLTFDRETGNASTTAPVKFTFPGGSGSGVGVDYSTHDATVRLQRAIQFQLAASDKTGGLPVSASGSSLEIHRTERTLVLNGPVNVQQGDRDLSAQKITVNFDASNRARQVLVDGQPQIRSNENGSAITVSAAQFEGVLNPAGWIEQVLADGNVQATRQAKGSTGRFSAGRVEFAMIPQRNLVESMTATGAVTAQSQQPGETDTLRTDALQVAFSTAEKAGRTNAKAAPNEIGQEHIQTAETLAPATIEMAKGSEKSTVSAEKFVAQAGGDGRIRKLLGHAGVTIRRESPGAVAQIISAPELVAELGSRGEWEKVEESGGVQMQQGERQATASSARIDRTTNAISLDGSPVVMDGQSRTTAERMAFNQKSGELQADGGVISTYAPPGEQGTDNPGAGAAHISAEALTGSANAGHVTYSGHVRLWQGESVLEADRIDLWRDEKKMQASGNVVAVFPQSAGPAVPSIPDFSKTKKKSAKDSGPALWKIHAPLLTYWGDQGRAHLQGGVLASSDQGTLHSQTLDVYLKQSPGKTPTLASTEALASKVPAQSEQIAALSALGGGQLDRVVARGGVVVEQGDRHGMAERAEYTASDGKFVLSGGEPTVTDGSNNSATGSSLTFYVASDTILIDSQQGSRTLTKHKVEK
jgi:lipopolysaccharide export system protein LptA